MYKTKMKWKYLKKHIPGNVNVIQKGLLINGKIVVDGPKNGKLLQ